MHTHKHIHTHTCAYIHTHLLINTRAQQMHSCTHMFIHTHSYTHAHTHTFIHTYAHKHTFIHTLSHTHTHTQICEALLDHCLAPDCRMGGLGCDNMTIVLACFLHKEGGGYTELARRCSVGHVNSSPIHRTELQKTRSLQVPNGGLDSRDSLPHRCGCSPPPFPGISKLSPEHSTSIDAYLESESLNHSGSGSDSGLSPSPSGKRVINGLNGFGDEGVNDESSEEEDPVETTV